MVPVVDCIKFVSIITVVTERYVMSNNSDDLDEFYAVNDRNH